MHDPPHLTFSEWGLSMYVLICLWPKSYDANSFICIERISGSMKTYPPPLKLNGHSLNDRLYVNCRLMHNIMLKGIYKTISVLKTNIRTKPVVDIL